MILSARAALLPAAVALVAAGCGGDDIGAERTTAVVATTNVWADVTSQVACGVPVDALIPAAADPHAFEPSLRDRARLEDADLVVANGADLEESLIDLLETVADGGTPIVEMADHIELPGGDADEHDADDEHDDDEHDDDEHDDDERGHGVVDPHVWLDPVRVADALDALAAALVDVGYDATDIGRCRDEYRAELMALDAELAETIATVPGAERLLVTNHDALGYFADRYGFEVIGTVVGSTSSLAATDPAALEALSATIRDRDIGVIFTEENESDVDAAALAARLDVRVVPLTASALAPNGPASTYTGMLRTLTAAIVEALRP